MKPRLTLPKLLAGSALIAAALPSYAAGTIAGTDVNNTASVAYQVGGVSQTAVSSNTATFKVDRRVNVTVAEVGGAYTLSAPGSTAQVLTFTVSNLSNAVEDFRLISSALTSGTSDAFGGTDAFDATNVKMYVDTNNNGTYEAGTDTLVTYLDEVPADASRTVFIVADIPAGQANNTTAGYNLTAVSAVGGAAGTQGADETETAGADGSTTVEVVFGDVSHTYTTGKTDAARDGRDTDDDAYKISSAVIAVTKFSTVISDPFNGTTNPKRIPGAVVEYCISVTNSGAASATDVVVTDPLTGQPVTFNAGSIFAGSTVACAAGTPGTGGTSEDDDASGADDTLSVSENTGSFSANTVTTSVKTVPASSTSSMRFRVTIN